MDIASSHAQNHKERIQILEDQLAAALSRGNELRQHVKELQVTVRCILSLENLVIILS